VVNLKRGASVLLAVCLVSGCSGSSGGSSSTGSASTAPAATTPGATTPGSTTTTVPGRTAPGSTVAPTRGSTSSSGSLPVAPGTTPSSPAPNQSPFLPPAPAPAPAPTQQQQQQVPPAPPPPPAPAPSTAFQGNGQGGPAQVSAGTYVKGIDVSDYQATIDWAQVANSGIGFAIARASDGYYHDKQFAANWAGMKANGIVRGVYQFFRASKDGVQQADDFLSLFTLEPGDLPPVCDVEVLDGVSASELKLQLAAWINEVQAKTGTVPLIYTAPGLWNGWSMPSYAQNGLWVANWGVSAPTIPHGWGDWTIWQYSDNVSVPGIPAGGVDGDEWHGTLADLYAYVGAQPGNAPPSSSSGSNAALKAALANCPTLQQGDSGLNVTNLQNGLIAAGYSPGVADGSFGPNTKAALVAFQSANGLTADGIFGPMTRAALIAAIP
jgi:lysozyme